MRYFYKKKI